MPVQKHDVRPVKRPSGLVPPPVELRGITELRLHGVGGTAPENLLGDVAPQLASGDRIAGFYRTADLDGRHVEAYSWGGLTSRSASRVLWLLLFPFALANLAGWMCTAKAWQSRWRFYLHRTLVRWAALGLTVNLLLVTAMTTMDLVGYQCGGQADCVDRWWLRWLRFGPLDDHPGWRVLVGAAVPLLVILGLVVLAGRSLSRYEEVHPPYREGDQPAAEVSTSTPARPRVGLDDPDFWSGKRSVGDLALIHIGTALAFLAWITAYTVHSIPLEMGAPLRGSGWYTAAAISAFIVLLGALVLLSLNTVPRRLITAVALLGLLAAGCAIVLSLLQPAAPGHALASSPGPLPGMRLAANWTYGWCIGAALAVLLSSAVSGRSTFGVAAPFVAITLGVVLLNGVGIGSMIRVADLLGNVPSPGGSATRPNPLYVYPIIYAVTPYLTLLPVVILLCFALVEAFTLWHAARSSRRAIVRSDYLAIPRPAPSSVWDRSAVADDEESDGKIAKRSYLLRLWAEMRRVGWAARIARGRRLAQMPRDVDKLLTLIAFIALATLVYSWIVIWRYDTLPYARPWMVTMATWLAAAIPFAVLLLLRWGWRGLDSRRHLGVLWDVGTFWPRAYHPLAPPSYAERAVPELQRRLWRLHDSGGRVVLAAHSQGSVIALAALLQSRRRPPDDKVAVVTFGSPLRKLYGWAFPAYFDDGTLDRGRQRMWAWRNFHYDTDYIGGPVLADTATNKVDQRLDDPPTSWYVFGQQSPPLGRHSGYWIDPQVWDQVDTYATNLPIPTGPPAAGTRMAADAGSGVPPAAG